MIRIIGHVESVNGPGGRTMERSAVLRHTAHDLRGLSRSHYYSIETEDILACVDKGCLRSSGALGDLAVSTLSPRPCRVINYLQLLMDSADVIVVFLP